MFDLGCDAVQGLQDDRVFLQPFVEAGKTKHFHDELFAPETGFDFAYERWKLLHELLVRCFGGELDAVAQVLARLPQGGADGVRVQFGWVGCSHGMPLALS